MSNISGIYSDITRGPIEKTKEESPATEALAFQNIVDWLNEPLTRSMFRELRKEYESLLNKALVLSVNFPQTNNHQQIVQTLTEAAAIRKVVETYGKV